HRFRGQARHRRCAGRVGAFNRFSRTCLHPLSCPGAGRGARLADAAMTGIDDIRGKLAQARAGTADAAHEIAVKREELRKLKREAAAARRLGAAGAQRATELEAKAKSLSADIESKRKRLGNLKSNVADQLHQ